MTAATQFAASTRDHHMLVLHDTAPDAPYRHLRFQRPDGSALWRIDLVTWPGHLAVSGDVHQLLFRYQGDMVRFFNEPRINPGYWAEKVVAGRTRTDFCVDKYERLVREHVDETVEGLTDDEAALVRETAEQDLLTTDVYSHDLAHHALMDFRVELDGERTVEFYDTWEWDLRDWDHHYLIACHAVRWGVQQYLAGDGQIARTT